MHLRYGIILWGRDSESKMAFQVQKKVICIISGACKCSPVGKFLKLIESLQGILYIF
jgi:hypothetical protein